MKVLVYSAASYEVDTLTGLNPKDEFVYRNDVLTTQNASEAKGFDAICTFVNDPIPAETVKALAQAGVKLILQRSTGFDRIDLDACKENGIAVYYVPGYSAETVAEHGMSLLMTLNRQIHIASQRTRISNYNIEGLVGSVIHGKTFGIIGGGRIGQCFIRIAKGFGAKVLVNDNFLRDNNPNAQELAKDLGFDFVELDELLAKSDFISLHAFYTDQSRHLINKETISKMKDGVILINVARGGFVDADALLDGLNSGKVRGAGLDVYEYESGKFFFDKSNEINQDETLVKLQQHRNVILTSHQAFLTEKALDDIFNQVLTNIKDFEEGNESRTKLA